MGKKDAGKDGHGETLIGVGTVLEGTFDIEYDVRVDGTMRGKRLATRQRLTVGPQGQVQAESIEVAEALIDGQVDGRLVARERIHLTSGARFKGVMLTPKLVIEEGATMEAGEESM